jgi:hypothetical protein
MLMLALVGTSLPGCAGGHHHRRAAESHAPQGAHRERAGALDRARALSFARAVNLVALDVPGFSASRAHTSRSRADRLAEAHLLRCAGTPRSHADVAEASSSTFQLKRNVVELSVSSEVSVARSPSLAVAELAAIHSARVRRCFTRYLQLLLRRERVGGVSVERVSIQSGDPPAPGTSGSFGWRVTATFAARGITLPVYLDLLGFVEGPARVTLVSSGALRPFPAAIQQRLFALLLARAKAHSLPRS